MQTVKKKVRNSTVEWEQVGRNIKFKRIPIRTRECIE